MTESEEQIYLQGRRQANINLLHHVMRELDYECEDIDKARLVLHIEETRQSLESLRRDLDAPVWTENLWMPDVIEKYIRPSAVK